MNDFEEFNCGEFDYYKFKESMKFFGLSCAENVKDIKSSRFSYTEVEKNLILYGEFRNKANLTSTMHEFINNLRLLHECSLYEDINVSEFNSKDSSFSDLVNLVRKDVCILRKFLDDNPNLSDKFKSCINLIADLMCFASLDVYRFHVLLPQLTQRHEFRNLIDPYLKVQTTNKF